MLGLIIPLVIFKENTETVFTDLIQFPFYLKVIESVIDSDST